MDDGKIALLILVSGLWVFTVACLVVAVYRRRLLESWRGHADYEDLRLYTNDQVFFEALRLTKHGVLVWLIAVTPDTPPPLAETRNIGIAAVGVLLGFTSAFVLYRKHKRFKHFRERVQL